MAALRINLTSGCRRNAAASPRPTAYLTIPETVDGVVVDNSHALHERVADSGAHEAEAAPDKIFAQRIRFRRSRRHLTHAAPAIQSGPPADEAPRVAVEAPELPRHREQGPGVGHGALDLEPVANDAGIAQQPGHARRGESGDPRRIKLLDDLAITGALPEDGFPTQAGLSTLQDQKFEEQPVIVHRHAPFGIMIGNPELGARPRAAHRRGHFVPLLAVFFFRGRSLPYVPRKILPFLDLRSPFPMRAPVWRVRISPRDRRCLPSVETS